ncbi:metal-dependent hydrolase [Halorubrum sp. CBA1125]|uniref:metal-dependent hydrolase n=1 Tax=Halorubrum sp. CBA1125 TaxID=2668072 RepID=UPI0012E8871C|nr:metal-dependent hydrolase [Halorubrum sp. CBA1125]MUW15322.1 metal-dependent hydrolase [Halorubrum sp. CBA1125]
MMLPTHVLGGMLLAAPLAYAAPELAPVGFVAGFLGGLVPDLDMYVGHRRTLHYPVYYSALAAVALPVALLAPSAATVGVAVFLIAAALHSVSDVYGGGLELRPWEGTSDRAVYDHYRGRWIAPRRVVRYDGAVEDLALSVGLSLPLLYLVDGTLRWIVLGAVAVAVAYTVLRRHLADLAARIAPIAPAVLTPFLPDRYCDEDPES